MKINTEILKMRIKAKVCFSYYKDQVLWYNCYDNWEFPVPIEDTVNPQGGSATFNASEKGILLMRWIRKQMETEVKATNEQN